ncbi:MAG: DUF4167 domain-containing protein [Bradyrhizobium sp.]|uniref:DUF4167 domain-containing protein n=1 Tax=Bradyrhizobium sp. TaxID=376 RepID=UPI002A256841|nr:DUF4167 domain-containing protein [Bradyrhizobium sp.]
MRNGQNKQRMRNRNNNNQNRRGQNPLTRVYESNGPDIKIRGTASHIAEKYVQLARDARSSGDPVAAENYYQHAEHYFRLIAAAQEQFRQNQPQHQHQPRPDNDMSTEEGEDDADGFSPFGQEPGFAPQPQQQQPYMRDGNPRDREQQPYQRDQQQPREQRGEREHREHRPQPQYQPQPSQPQPAVADSVDRLPSFITGAQPQINGGERNYEGGGGGGERYPRRRRRPHGPRPDNMAGAAPATSGEDMGGE